MKYYYGAWHNFYQLNWPVRFFIELVILLLVIYLLYRAVRSIGKRYRLNVALAKCWAWFVREVVYLIGRNKNWAIEFDDKMIEWQSKIEEKKIGKKHRVLKRCFCVGIVILYLCAILVDLPISKNLQEYYLTEFAGIKDNCQRMERFLSNGYENYPPLISVTEPVVQTGEDVDVEQSEPIYIKLNKKGKNGAKIRSGPSIQEQSVITVNDETEIIYNWQWEYDGKRYWIKVYIPMYEVEGWLNGNMIKSSVLNNITG